MSEFRKTLIEKVANLKREMDYTMVQVLTDIIKEYGDEIDDGELVLGIDYEYAIEEGLTYVVESLYLDKKGDIYVVHEGSDLAHGIYIETMLNYVDIYNYVAKSWK